MLPDRHPLRNGYDVVGCGRCDFVFADSAASQSDYDLYYSDFSKYEDNHTGTGGGESVLDSDRVGEVAREIDRFLQGHPARILDIGCANGGILRELKRLGHQRLAGVDPSAACVDHVQNRLGIEAHRASLFDMPVVVGPRDLIILSHVLEHVLDLRGCLGRVGAFLDPEGVIYAEVPDAMRYADFVTSPFQDFNTEHINHFTEVSLDNLFSGAGFERVGGGAKIMESAPGMPYPAIFSFYKKRSPPDAADYRKDPAIDGSIRRYRDASQGIIDRVNDLLHREFRGDGEVLVWGTGQLTLKLLAMSGLGKLRIRNFIDSNPVFRGKVLNGVRIIHPDEMGNDLGGLKILITSTIHEQAIRADITGRYKLPNPLVGLGTCMRPSGSHLPG